MYPPDPDGRSSLAAKKEGGRRGKDPGVWILQPAVCYPQEHRVAQTCPRLEESKHAHQRAGFQDGAARLNNPNDQENGLHCVSRPRRYVHTHSIHKSYKNYLRFYWNGKVISAYLDDIVNIGGIEGGMCKEYGPSILQADGSGKQNRIREVVDDSITVDNPSRYVYQFSEHEPQGSFLQDPGPPPISE
ncbi:hypothetical protein AYI69_g8962 [Smittium culicis]|uniref:Uncharacterized protein n=1 Tax=Smittium culicis TaxID=133412 RepID=A0A1R1XG08_9FUNG|nr:hypothetical protein AYI69_g8962 [Smittium culicis]